MRKLIAAINMTVDGFCDHTAGIANDETHEHYNELLRCAGALIYGRVTYQLMENYWPSVVRNPTGNKSIDDFAVLIDDIPKIVYSRTMDKVDWKNTTLKREINKQEILELKQTHNGNNKDIFVGSPGLIVGLTQLNLVDEYQLAIHPVILGKGLTLFKNLREQVDLKLIKTKTLNCGVVVLYYETIRRSGL